MFYRCELVVREWRIGDRLPLFVLVTDLLKIKLGFVVNKIMWYILRRWNFLTSCTVVPKTQPASKVPCILRIPVQEFP